MMDSAKIAQMKISEADTVIQALSVDHVVRLTGLTQTQLRYWDKIGFFQPALAVDNRRLPYSRVYSFKDVVGLRVISVLLHQHHVSLHHLKEVAAKLAQYSPDAWANIRLYVLNRRIQFEEPDTGQMRGVVDGQYAIAAMVDVIRDMREETAKLRVRTPEQVGILERHRHVAHHATVLGGTRIPVRVIQEFHDAGYSDAAILEEYPTLTEADIAAALAFSDKVAA